MPKNIPSLKPKELIKLFADDLYRYLNFDQIAGFEDEGRVILLEDMPRI